MEGILEKERNSRTERKKKEAKERILAAAERFFIAENSYDETTIREIADKADVGIGTVYNHFNTKAHILVELVKRHIKSLKLRMAMAIPESGTGAEKIGALLGFFDELRHDPMLVLWRRRPLIQIDMEQVNPEREESFSDFQRIVADILRSGAADGTLRPADDPDLSAAVLMRIALSFILDITSENSSFSHYFPLLPYDEDTVFALFCDFIQNNLSPSPGPGYPAKRSPQKNQKDKFNRKVKEVVSDQ
jgi:AcrR family transcriptional regulator